MSCFAGSPRALERLDVASGPERWLDSLAKLRPELDLDRAGAVLSTWADDPWVRGAYSTSPPTALAAASEQALGPLAFAGEHLGGEFAALMEGAIRSGRRRPGAVGSAGAALRRTAAAQGAERSPSGGGWRVMAGVVPALAYVQRERRLNTGPT